MAKTLKWFTVVFEYRIKEEIEVEAKDKAEAEALAEGQSDAPYNAELLKVIIHEDA